MQGEEANIEQRSDASHILRKLRIVIPPPPQNYQIGQTRISGAQRVAVWGLRKAKSSNYWERSDHVRGRHFMVAIFGT
jgi:hypothetical protein